MAIHRWQFKTELGRLTSRITLSCPAFLAIVPSMAKSKTEKRE
jgi:hypothetical protein